MGNTRADLNAMVALYDTSLLISQEYTTYHKMLQRNQKICASPPSLYTRDAILQRIAQEVFDKTAEEERDSLIQPHADRKLLLQSLHLVVVRNTQSLAVNQNIYSNVLPVFDMLDSRDGKHVFMSGAGEHLSLSALVVFMLFVMQGEAEAFLHRVESIMQQFHNQWDDLLTNAGTYQLFRIHVLNAVNHSIYTGVHHDMMTPWEWVRPLFMQEVLKNIDNMTLFQDLYNRPMVQDALNYTTFKDM